MLTHTSQLSIFLLLAILLPSTFSFPYSIYDVKNYRRPSRANNNNPVYSSSSRQQYDQSYRSPSSQYYPNYDTYDSGADNFYVDDESEDVPPAREYLYGKPTYHGEYKPTRYCYARAPSYNYYNDHVESTNPLDDLHEKMLQEDHNRQRKIQSPEPKYFQNTEQQLKSSTSNFMKNLLAYKKDLEDTDTIEMNSGYDDEDIGKSYFPDSFSNQNNEPVDYFDPIKYQTHQFNHPNSPLLTKPNYFNHENTKTYEWPVPNESKNKNKNHKQNDNKNDDFMREDKEAKELESLREPHKPQLWHNNDYDDEETIATKQLLDEAMEDRRKFDEDTHFNTDFDYDQDQWINWNRKRSLPKQQLRPLKALEYELTKALHQQADTSKVSPTTMSTTTTTSSSNSKMHEHRGQKEVVLSRPATPLRRHFPDNVLEALTKTTNEMKQSNQEMDTNTKDAKNDEKQQLKHSLGTKKQKRYVSSESSLVQQLNDLKQKITA